MFLQQYAHVFVAHGVVIAMLLLLLGGDWVDPEPNYCAMTMSRPLYEPVRVPHPPRPHYRLFRFTNGMRTRHERPTQPLIFVPGHRGSYQQVRSLGSVLAELEERAAAPAWDVFTVDFGDEWSGVHGGVLHDQATFLHACLAMVGGRYVTLVAHSMGGVVARVVAVETHEVRVRAVITLASPLFAPPWPVDGSMGAFYRRATNDTADTGILVSLGGGRRDEEVPLQLVSTTCSSSSTTSSSSSSSSSSSTPVFAASTTSIPGAWSSTDHRSILWCRQLLLGIGRALAALVVEAEDGSPSTRLEIVRRVLQDPLPVLLASPSSWSEGAWTPTTHPELLAPLSMTLAPNATARCDYRTVTTGSLWQKIVVDRGVDGFVDVTGLIASGEKSVVTVTVLRADGQILSLNHDGIVRLPSERRIFGGPHKKGDRWRPSTLFYLPSQSLAGDDPRTPSATIFVRISRGGVLYACCTSLDVESSSHVLSGGLFSRWTFFVPPTLAPVAVADVRMPNLPLAVLKIRVESQENPSSTNSSHWAPLLHAHSVGTGPADGHYWPDVAHASFRPWGGDRRTVRMVLLHGPSAGCTYEVSVGVDLLATFRRIAVERGPLILSGYVSALLLATDVVSWRVLLGNVGLACTVVLCGIPSPTETPWILPVAAVLGAACASFVEHLLSFPALLLQRFRSEEGRNSPVSLGWWGVLGVALAFLARVWAHPMLGVLVVGIWSLLVSWWKGSERAVCLLRLAIIRNLVIVALRVGFVMDGAITLSHATECLPPLVDLLLLTSILPGSAQPLPFVVRGLLGGCVLLLARSTLYPLPTILATNATVSVLRLALRSGGGGSSRRIISPSPCGATG